MFGNWLDRVRARLFELDAEVLTATTPDGTRARTTGIVRTDGRVLTTPLRGRASVAYRTAASSQSARRGGRQAPVDYIELADVTSFKLETAEGLVHVDGTDAVLVGHRRNTRRVPLARAVQFMLANGWQPYARTRPSYVEQSVEPGDRVEVVGVVMRDAVDAPPSGEQGFRDEPRVQVTLAGDAKHRLIIVAR